MKFSNQRNPILPLSVHIPDSEAHVMSDGRVYIYGSYDDRSDVYCSEKYYVVSTGDMKEWTIHEEAFHGKQVPWFHDPNAPKYPGIDWSHPTPFIQKMIQRDMEKGVDIKAKFEEEEKNQKEQPALLFAPDCIEKDGKFYLYFCMPDDSEGVAVSDYPQGPFTDPVQLPCGGIDPAVFRDNDGSVYFYWGQLFSHGVKLNGDICSFDPENVVHNLVTEEEHFFHEGSSMRKCGDTYYYVYADMERGKPTSLGYSVGKSPLGPFEYKGIIIDNAECDPESWNNHGSIECIDGQWYVFYHRCSRGTQQYRRLCIEKIEILPDGTIPEVKMTSQGIGEPFAPGEKIMGYQACVLKGTAFIDVNKNPDEKEEYPELLTNLSIGDRILFRYVKSEEAWKQMEMEYHGAGKLRINMNGKEAGVMEFGRTESLDFKCQKETASIEMPKGEYEVELEVLEAEGLEILSFTMR